MQILPGSFIRANRPFVPGYAEANPAPMFRKRFSLGRFARAEIAVCALGIGVFYVNGRPMTQDLHISPTGDYNQTLWFNRYDVTPLVREGENLIACILGNGWYNETLETTWDFDKAPWRDNPKFALTLYVDGEPAVTCDDSWLCMPESWITFNQFRSGEHADMRLYDPLWNQPECDESRWERAIADPTPPRGKFRESTCPPVRACKRYPALSVRQTGPKRYLFDLGQNMSGFVRLRVQQHAGDVLTIRYSEQVLENGERKGNQMPEFYPRSPFQTDILTLGDAPVEYSPMFTCHGFHFIEIDGLDAASPDMVEGVFIHLDLDRLGFFECSNPDVNDLFRIGVNACYSNMHYILTDCPTREKLGWLNDARASAEQLLMNFDIAPFFRKWYRDICESMRESDGAIAGIAPTSGCLYDDFTGPICTSALHEIAYKTYIYTGDDSLLLLGLPVMLRHLEYIGTRQNADGLVGFGLYDWAGPFSEDFNLPAPTPVTLTDTALWYEFAQRTAFAAGRAGRTELLPELEALQARIRANFMRAYIGADGRCTVNEQTACAMILVLGLCDDPAPIQAQLKACVEATDFHMHCGMLGIRFLYDALNLCGAPEYAYRVIAAEGFPSFTQWLRQGATTLWELFYDGASKNHHMYSCFMLFLMDTLGGIRFSTREPGGTHIEIAPQFVEGLSYCRARRRFPLGDLEVRWRRERGGVRLEIHVPEGIACRYAGRMLPAGDSTFTI